MPDYGIANKSVEMGQNCPAGFNEGESNLYKLQYIHYAGTSSRKLGQLSSGGETNSQCLSDLEKGFNFFLFFGHMEKRISEPYNSTILFESTTRTERLRNSVIQRC